MIAVVGAGPAGLMAAWRAALAGHEVTVVERAPIPGGMAGSFEVAGVRVDHGSHRLHPSTAPHLLAALGELLGDDLQERPRHGRIRLHDRWLAFPLRATDLLRRLPPRVATGAAVDALLSPLRRRREAADTFADEVRRGLGGTVYDAFYGPYSRKLWGIGGEALSGELARRRVSASAPADIARRLVRGARPEGRTFLYPRTGFGAIPEALAEAAVKAGADVVLGTAVERIREASGGWRLELEGGRTLDAQRVWSTAPLPELAKMVDPGPPDEVMAAAGRLSHRGLVLLYLALDQPQWSPFDAHYFPGPEVLAARLSEPGNYRDDPHVPAATTVLCAEIACTVGDPVWDGEPTDLATRLVAELAACGLPAVRPVEVVARRLPRVYPLYRPGFEWDLSALELWATSRPGLLTFGRQGLFVPDNTHHALAMGWAAAGALGAGGQFDDEAWLAARDGFRDFVVED